MLSRLFHKVPWLTLSLLMVMAGLQYQLWLGPRGLVASFKLKREVKKLKANDQQQASQNQTLRTKIKSLKSKPQSIETIARYHLGMIKKGETFYQVIDADGHN